MTNLAQQIFSKVQGDKDLITKLGSKIPGFSGYIERQERRNSDKLLRETIADRFMEQEHRVGDLQQELLSEGHLELLDEVEKGALRIRTFADRIRTAARGYSGFFDAVKINEEELTKMYEYDMTMLEMSEEVGRAIDHVYQSIGSDGLKAAIRNLNTVSQGCIDYFNRREEVVLSVA
jgi:hypothetical protein